MCSLMSDNVLLSFTRFIDITKRRSIFQFYEFCPRVSISKINNPVTLNILLVEIASYAQRTNTALGVCVACSGDIKLTSSSLRKR